MTAAPLDRIDCLDLAQMQAPARRDALDQRSSIVALFAARMQSDERCADDRAAWPTEAVMVHSVLTKLLDAEIH